MPTCGIYKITNQINEKCYIGQSVNIEKRWIAHKSNAANSDFKYKTALYPAIKKYGLSNFTFEIIEECLPDQLDEKEKYYIQYFNSISPNGYNLSEGGQGSKGFGKKLDQDTVNLIKVQLKNSLKTQREIAEDFNLSQRTICDINLGEIWYDGNEKYPLRDKNSFRKKRVLYKRQEREKLRKEFSSKVEVQAKQKPKRQIKRPRIRTPQKFCPICGKPIFHINQHYCSYQCRNIGFQIAERPSKEELKSLIRNKSFLSIGKQFKVSDNAIRKWCKSYRLPSSKTEIKQISDEDWKLI